MRKDSFTRLHGPALRINDIKALQTRAGQRSITTNIWPLTAHIYHVMIIVIGGFSKSFYLLILFLFFRNSFK